MLLSSPVPIATAHLFSPFFFFFNDTATTEIYTLSLHDALPISHCVPPRCPGDGANRRLPERSTAGDRKSTRLNSSHSQISYAVFCLQKKTQTCKEVPTGQEGQVAMKSPTLALGYLNDSVSTFRTRLNGYYLSFFFNDTATTEIYTLSLHDALPISSNTGPATGATQDREPARRKQVGSRSEEHTSELQSQSNLVCRLLLEKKKK